MNTNASVFRKPKSILNIPTKLQSNTRMEFSVDTPSDDMEGLASLFR